MILSICRPVERYKRSKYYDHQQQSCHRRESKPAFGDESFEYDDQHPLDDNGASEERSRDVLLHISPWGGDQYMVDLECRSDSCNCNHNMVAVQ